MKQCIQVRKSWSHFFRALLWEKASTTMPWFEKQKQANKQTKKGFKNPVTEKILNLLPGREHHQQSQKPNARQ